MSLKIRMARPSVGGEEVRADNRALNKNIDVDFRSTVGKNCRNLPVDKNRW
jgi:hypothetical protein